MILRFLGSLKLALFLIIALIALSVLGTLIPQVPSRELTLRESRPTGLLAVLGAHDIYRSPPFLGVLFLFSLNIAVCTLTRLGPKARRIFRPSFETDAGALLAVPNSAGLTMRAGLSAAVAAVGQALRLRRFRVRVSETPGRAVLLGRKRSAGLFGADVVHLGLLVIIAGGVLSGLAGFRTVLELEEGRTEAVPRSGFSLRLERFEVETYPEGPVKAWKSHLTVLEDGRPVLGRTVEVNHPLSHRGFLFYQSGYAPDRERPVLGLAVTALPGGSFRRDVSARPGSPVSLEENGSSLIVRRFVPDFVMNERREVLSRSDEPRNPAALVEIQKDGQVVHRDWVFARHPEYGGAHSRQDSEYRVAFLSLKYDLISLIEAARDPGTPLIWVGCGLVMAGLFLAFYWPAREIRVLLETAPGRTRLTAAAAGRKSREALAEEFVSLVKEWRGSR